MNRGQASDLVIKSTLPPSQKLMLLVYLMHQSSKDKPEEGSSWPALVTLSMLIGASKTHTIATREALRVAGILLPVGGPTTGSVSYRIAFDLIPQWTEDGKEAYRKKIKQIKEPEWGTPGLPGGYTGTTPPGTLGLPPGYTGTTPPGSHTLPGGYTGTTQSLRREPPAVEPSPGNHHQENRPQGTGGAEVSATVTDSPPPAEPSGSPADIWSRAADLADPEAGRASEEFQPSSNAYVFDDAEPVAVIEQPSDPRQIESPAQPFDPIEEFATPSPPPSASPAARPRGLSSEGAPGPAGGPQDAPSLFGRTDTAPEAQTPAKAPPRARKATAADKAADALAVYGAWRVYHPRAAETPTPGTLRALGSLLTEAGSREDALLLIEWAHVGTCERARQIQGVAPWPDRRLKALWDLESLSRHVAARLEMAYEWKDKSTDKDTGLKVLHVPETPRAPFRGRDTTHAMNVLGNIVRKDLEARNVL